MLENMLYTELMLTAESRHLYDGTWLLFFPPIKRCFIRTVHSYRMVSAESIDDAESMYYMKMDAEVMYG